MPVSAARVRPSVTRAILSCSLSQALVIAWISAVTSGFQVLSSVVQQRRFVVSSCTNAKELLLKLRVTLNNLRHHQLFAYKCRAQFVQ